MTTLVLHLGEYDLKGLYSLEEYYAKNLLAYYRAISIGPSNELLKDIKFNVGLFHMEFKMNSHGDPKFIELNPRIAGGHGAMTTMERVSYGRTQIDALLDLLDGKEQRHEFPIPMGPKSRAILVETPEKGYSEVSKVLEEVIKVEGGIIKHIPPQMEPKVDDANHPLLASCVVVVKADTDDELNKKDSIIRKKMVDPRFFKEWPSQNKNNLTLSTNSSTVFSEKRQSLLNNKKSESELERVSALRREA